MCEEIANDMLETLKSCDKKNTCRFELKGKYTAKIIDVYDGDTVTIAMFLYNQGPFKFSCRCMRYNTAEIRTSDPDEKDKAIKARDYLRGRVLDKIVKIESMGMDKYGRPLIEIFLDNININDEMLKQGLGKPYDGTGKKEY